MAFTFPPACLISTQILCLPVNNAHANAPCDSRCRPLLPPSGVKRAYAWPGLTFSLCINKIFPLTLIYLHYTLDYCHLLHFLLFSQIEHSFCICAACHACKVISGCFIDVAIYYYLWQQWSSNMKPNKVNINVTWMLQAQLQRSVLQQLAKAPGVLM